MSTINIEKYQRLKAEHRRRYAELRLLMEDQQELHGECRHLEAHLSVIKQHRHTEDDLKKAQNKINAAKKRHQEAYQKYEAMQDDMQPLGQLMTRLDEAVKDWGIEITGTDVSIPGTCNGTQSQANSYR